MAWRFEWRRTWAEVWAEDFAGTWRRLLEASASAQVYHVPSLVRAWAETYGAAVSAAPTFGLARDDDGRTVLLPWVVVPHAGRVVRRRVLEPVGSSLFAYHDPLVARDDLERVDWPGLWDGARRELAQTCDTALFRFVHRRHLGPAGIGAEPCADESPVLDLSGVRSLEEALARCSTNHRGDVRRRLRRLAEKGDVRLWVAGPAESHEAIRSFRHDFVAAYHHVWRGRPSGSLLDRPGTLAFMTRVVSEGVPAGWAHYAALLVGDTPVAWHLGLSHADSLHWWVPTHDRAWEAWSPGKALLAKIVEHAIARGFTSLHLLTGGQPYKLAWRPEPEDLVSVRWHAPALTGRILGWYDALHGARRT